MGLAVATACVSPFMASQTRRGPVSDRTASAEHTTPCALWGAQGDLTTGLGSLQGMAVQLQPRPGALS